MSPEGRDSVNHSLATHQVSGLLPPWACRHHHRMARPAGGRADGNARHHRHRIDCCVTLPSSWATASRTSVGIAR